MQLFRQRLSGKRARDNPERLYGIWSILSSWRLQLSNLLLLLLFISTHKHMSMASPTILSSFLEQQGTQNHPQYLSGLSRAFFSTTSLEIADKNKQTNKQNKNKEKKTVPFSDSLFFWRKGGRCTDSISPQRPVGASKWLDQINQIKFNRIWKKKDNDNYTQFSGQPRPHPFLREKPWGRGCSADQTDCETLNGSLDFSLCSPLFRQVSFPKCNYQHHTFH